MSEAIQIRPAREQDVAALWGMVRREAEYEKLSDHFSATEELLRGTLFGSRPAPAEVLIAWAGDEPVGFAAFFPTYSTFSATVSLWLEDLFVEERWRSKGVGRKLMAQLARLAHERGANSIGWSVLKWNERAIGFYHRIGGEQLEAWHYFQLRGEALDQLARDATSR